MATLSSHAFDLQDALRRPISRKVRHGDTAPAARAPANASLNEDQLWSRAHEDACTWKITGRKSRLTEIKRRYKNADHTIRKSLQILKKSASEGHQVPDELNYFLGSTTLLRAVLRDVRRSLARDPGLPDVETARYGNVPRVYAAVESYLRAANFNCDAAGISKYLTAAQKRMPLTFAEFWMLGALTQLVLLERIAAAANNFISEWEHRAKSATSQETACAVSISALIKCLQRSADLDWNQALEDVSITETILRQDPLKIYSRMDFDSRNLYRNAVADLSAHSRLTEQEIAREAVAMASTPQSVSSARARERRSHVGYYLVDKGASSLQEAIGYRPAAIERIRKLVLDHPDFFYSLLIELGTLAMIALAVTGVRVKFLSFTQVALLLLPAIECALAATNMLATQFVLPRRLAKLDFSNGIPDDKITVVAVPALLTSKEQVEHAVRDLEIRFLGNRDANLHFALITDLPDSAEECNDKDSLASHCSHLIERLNARYEGGGSGSFFHFHRQCVYNPSEGKWMGWERKRGKLLDFNNLILGKNDNFPVKIGNLSLLRNVKYVITLDLDTQLPRDSAWKLVGSLAHPLNEANVDPESNIVVEGYGILQPRVSISINSANRSRFAAMFSSDTRFDIYTRAVSEVYHDLFGEGIFAGKGIYEVSTFQKVLEHRFPCNTILSHDLIEGAFVRTGLASDIEVIDDYPTHMSAYNRRKHRWVRGDWQIIRWLFPRVPNSSGELVHNPLSPLSRWKIADNLRRSLTEFATLLLLLYGFFVAPEKGLAWTIACLAILVFPTYLQFGLSIARAGGMMWTAQFWKETFSDFAHRHADLFLRLVLLCHQTFVTLDAIIRTLFRMTVTRKRLLQWETAAQAELETGTKDRAETYLIWASLLPVVAGIVLALVRPSSLAIAFPFLALWGLSEFFCRWLDRPLTKGRRGIHASERALLRRASLRTWRYFQEFSTAEENWLIPDAIQLAPALVAHRISPTNLGFLFNSRLAAYDLGFLTLPELVEETGKTMDTAMRMAKCNGHFYNWYDTQTLEPVAPRFVSSVDSGNLVCSLWTLKQACQGARKEPLLRKALWEGICDHLDIVIDHLPTQGRHDILILEIKSLKDRLKALGWSNREWIQTLPGLEIEVAEIEARVSSDETADEAVKRWTHELVNRVIHIKRMVEGLAPWLLPQFAGCWTDGDLQGMIEIDEVTLESLQTIQAALAVELGNQVLNEKCAPETRSLMGSLLALLSRSANLSREMGNKLCELSESVSSLVQDMDFKCLFNPAKKMLSIGLNAEEGRLMEYHYDLLASEARAAVFAAIAKGDIPQESWFRLGRTQVLRGNKRTLLSWSGTMFEYLMPALWMKSYPNTVLDECGRVAVRAQQIAARKRSIPWGISESSCSERNPDGRYRYHAFGLPGLALSRAYEGDLVISPYSSFLALQVHEVSAAKNLSQMEEMGWLGAYGFFEACDYTPSRVRPGNQFEIVRCWMAHHQGMSLVSAANILCDASTQHRFHNEPMVSATERLLQEKFGGIPIPDVDEEPGEADSSILAIPAKWRQLKTNGLVLSGDSVIQRNP